MLLERLTKRSKPINVSIVGIGSIGKGLVFQVHNTPGMQVIAIADIKIERAQSCAEWLGLDYQIVSTPAALHDTIAQGKVALSDDGQLIAQCEPADVFIEATNAIAEAGRHALTALDHHTHLVMMNYEADLLFGPALLAKAEEKGLVYTAADGDQPAVLKRLIDDMLLWGFDLVMAGNIKGYLDRYSDPTKIIPEADKRNLDYKMCASYTDGSKLCVEMAVLANALGLRTAVPGMIGPRAEFVHDVFDLYDLPTLWQDKQPVVDYILGAQPTGGVFVIGHTDDPFQQFTLDWFPPKMGPGPFYLFYRPYHLGHIEAMACVAEAVMDGTARLRPDHGLRTNVYCYAKRDLKAGDTIDGMGGYASYGLIENLSDNKLRPGIPICLSDDVVLKRDIAKDEKIYLEDVTYDANSFQFKLYADALKQGSR